MKLLDSQQKFSLYVSGLIRYIYDCGYKCTLGDAYRSTEQAAIYANLSVGVKNSLHCKRLAIDINLFSKTGEYLNKTESYVRFGEYWESLDPNNRWGGHFKRPDGNHFETQEEYEEQKKH